MSRLRVGIDGYNLALPAGTGVSTYGMTLARTLASMGLGVEGVFGIDAGRSCDEALFFDRLANPVEPKRPWAGGRIARMALAFGAATAREVRLDGHVDLAPLRDRLPHFDRIVTSTDLFVRAYGHFRRTGRFTTLRVASPPDVMHWTYPIPVRLHGARNVYTLHDLVPLRLPYASRDNKIVYRRLVERCVATADHICTVSETSRRDIVDLLGADPEQVTNTYQISPMAIDPVAAGDEDANTVSGVFGLQPGGYFLYYGAIEPKKNVGRLLEAYLSARLDTPLVVVSGRSWLSDAELMVLSGADRSDGAARDERIRWIEYLPRRLLLSLVRCARAVTFPSLYEGFGLPVHEAMLLGTPVLAGDTGAIREVAGDAALLVDPLDVDAIRAGLRRLDGDAELRRVLSDAGCRQAATFSPARYATSLRAMYAKIVGLRDMPATDTREGRI